MMMEKKKKKKETKKENEVGSGDENDGKRGGKTQKGRKISWATVNTLDLMESPLAALGKNEFKTPVFQALLNPPSFMVNDMDVPISMFVANLTDYAPRVKVDESGQLFTKVATVVSSSSSKHMYGLLTHYVSIFAPTTIVFT